MPSPFSKHRSVIYVKMDLVRNKYEENVDRTSAFKFNASAFTHIIYSTIELIFKTLLELNASKYLLLLNFSLWYQMSCHFVQILKTF